MNSGAALDTTMLGVGHKTTIAGASASILGWFASSEAAVIYGLLAAVIGICIQLFFGFRRDRREQAEHDARMTLYKLGVDPDEHHSGS